MKRLGLLLLAVMLVVSLAACKHDSDDDDDDALKTLYGFNMNYTYTDGKTYHRVGRFDCVANDDGTYTVKKHSAHYFPTSNAYYTNASQKTLVSYIENETAVPQLKKEYTRSSDATNTIGDTVLYLYKGLTYQVYWY